MISMPPLRPVLVMLVLVIACPAIGAADRVQPKVSVEDALTVPGRPVTLEARLVERSLLTESGLGGEQLEFFVGGKKVGIAMTGGDGRAFLSYEPRMRGNLRLTVRVVESPRVAEAEGTATLFSWERRRPILLIEYAALVAKGAERPILPIPSLPPGPLAGVPSPEAGAAAELKKLTDFYYNPLYVIRGMPTGATERASVREWLQTNGFPVGFVVVIRDRDKHALAEMLADLEREGWDNVKAGIGRTVAFAEALAERRMTVVLVVDGNLGPLPRRVKVVEDWKDVRKKL